MKVFYINPMSYSNLGVYDYGLLSSLPMDDVTFFGARTFQFRGLLRHRFHGIYQYHALKGFAKVLSYVRSQLHLVTAGARSRPAIVHYQWLKIPALDEHIMRLLSWVSPKTKFVFTAHNVLPHDSGKAYRRVFHRIYHRLDAIIVHSASTKSEIRDHFGVAEEKIHVIPHGLLDLRFQSDFEPKAAVRQSIKPNGEVVFAILGSLMPYKGVDIALAAWRASPVLRDNPKVRLLLAGRSEGLDLGGDMPDNVTVIDRYLTEDEYLQYLTLVDVMLCPFRAISQSGSMMTALTEHIPVIVSRVGGLTDPFDVTPVGWILDELSVDCLQRTLEAIEADPVRALAPYRDDATWLRLEEHYSWPRIGRMTADLYQALAASA